LLSMRSLRLSIVFSWLFVGTVSLMQAQDWHLPLPKKSDYTAVQQLNRDGVKALQKHDIDKAKSLFYRAYLIDPNDPFTLNNLGYVAELEGQVDRAQRYYDQAGSNTSEAIVDMSTEQKAEGLTAAKVAGHSAPGQLQVNQLNSQAVRLLNQDRAAEADLVLQQALKIEPNNPFTLNNMGFAKEKEGELEEAIKNYSRAAATRSQEPVVVTIKREWRDRPISEIAAHNAEETRRELAQARTAEDRVARLNLRGVSAMNRNDRKTAREDFQQAYKLDPTNSFTINNMGFLAELDGDKETAQSYYQQAQDANHASRRVAAATRTDAEGRVVGQVAGESSQLVDASMQAQAEQKRRTGGPPVLRTRDNKTVVDKPGKPGSDYAPPEYRQPQPQQNEQQQKPPELKTRPK
jgi:Flp pilus assembly protein TadD